MKALVLHKLGQCRDASEAIAELERMGARRLGFGFYSQVFRVCLFEDRDLPSFRSYMEFDPVAYRPVPRMTDAKVNQKYRVIKVATTSDPGGLIVAKAAMLTAEYDDLAPRYYGITEFGDGTWMGELEELTMTDRGPFGGHGSMSSGLVSGGGHGRAPNPTVLSTSLYMQTVAKMKAKAEASGQYAHWDIHADNVMMRGAQPVITDPLSM